jgi:hypothetical protein
MGSRWIATFVVTAIAVALVLVPAAVQAQPGLLGRVAALEQEMAAALAAIAQLRAALAAERAARRAADAALREMDATLQQMIADATVPASLAALAPLVSVVPGPINGLAGPHVIFEGANVHIRSGSGTSHDGLFEFERFIRVDGTPRGLGNLIVGYNEEYPFGPRPRTGSHHVVVGPWHGFSGAAGLVTGLGNITSAVFNTAGAGPGNEATDAFAVVSAGAFNSASGWQSAVHGGVGNTASGLLGVVGGGDRNVAEGQRSTVAGGTSNTATGVYGVVSGGDRNVAEGERSTVGGGTLNTATDPGSFVP